jgi:hypothetical protein
MHQNRQGLLIAGLTRWLFQALKTALLCGKRLKPQLKADFTGKSSATIAAA